MSTKIDNTTNPNLDAMRLPELWERFRQVTGESSRCPNRKFLIRRIQEALAARANVSTAPLRTASTPATRSSPLRMPRRAVRSSRR